MRLRDSHRRYIRALTGEMLDLLDELHDEGVADELTADLAARIERLGQLLRLPAVDRGDIVGASLSRLWVLACELRAKSIAGYGELGTQERAYFDQQSALFEQSVNLLRDAIRARDGADRRNAPSPGSDRGS